MQYWPPYNLCGRPGNLSNMVASACSALLAGKVHLMFALTVHVYKDDIAVHSAVAQVPARHAASHPGQSLAASHPGQSLTARGSTGIRCTWPGGQVARWPGINSPGALVQTSRYLLLLSSIAAQGPR